MYAENLLVVSGHNGKFEKQLESEIVDLTFATARCRPYPYYPYATHGSVMGFVGNDPLNPVACGGLGHSENGYHNDTCTKLDVARGMWAVENKGVQATLAQPRIYSGMTHNARIHLHNNGQLASCYLCLKAGGYNLVGNLGRLRDTKPLKTSL